MSLKKIGEVLNNARVGVANSRLKQITIASFFAFITIFSVIYFNSKKAEALFFGTTSTLSTGSEPYQVKSADFDGVNGADLVYNYGNAGSFDLQVLLKNGTNTFAAPVSYATTGAANQICIADFDNANGPDIAAALYSAGPYYFAVYYNNGSGVFSETLYSTAAAPIHIECEDVNGDGKPDIEIGAGNDLVIATNNNWTGFNAETTYSFGFEISDLAIGDLNSDGYPDAIASNTVYSGQSSAAIIRNNAGSGFLTAEAGYVLVHGWCHDSPYCYPQTSATYLHIADLDGDGKNEVMASSRNSSYSTHYFYVSKNLTSTPGGVVSLDSYLPIYITGSFTYYPNDNIVFDRDGDGDLDITVLGADSSSGGISYITNNGGFTFTGPGAGGRQFAGGQNNRHITSGDYDLDGDTDVAYTSYGTDQLIIRYNDTVPVLSSISPTIVGKGDAVILTATGGNFTGTGISKVKFEGVDLTTTFVSETSLTASVTATETVAIGTYDITVFNGAPGGGTSTIQTLEVVPKVHFTTATSSGAEEVATQADFTITLTDAVVNDVVVNYTITGTANNGADYTWATGQATILASNTSVIVSIPLSDDLLDEENETIIMTLDSVVGSDAVVTNSTFTHTFSIIDNDPPPSVYFGSTTYNGSEGTALILYAYLDDPSGRAINVNYSLSDISTTTGVDYTAPSGTILFSAGETSKQVSINLLNDLVSEGDETFDVTIDSSDWSLLGSPLTTTVTINNVTPPTLSFTNGSASGTEGYGLGSAEVTISYSLPVDTTVYYSITNITSSGADYTSSGSFIYPANSYYAYPTIDLVADASYEAPETFDITLTSATLATITSPATITATIYDDHPVPFGNSQNINENNAPGSQTQQITVNLPTSYSGEAITFDVSASGGTAVNGVDYTFTNPTSVSILANNTTATFNVTTINDTTMDGVAPTIEFSFSNCNCDLSSATPFVVNINDTNPEPYDPGFNTVYESSSPQAQAVTIYLYTSFPDDLTFDVDVTGGTAVSGVDFVAFTTTTVTIPANTYIGNFNVTTISDATYDAPRTILFTMSNCVNCNLTTPSISVALIDNNDAAYLANPTPSVVEGNTEGSNGFYIEPSSGIVETVSFSIDPASTATYGDDYTIDTSGAVAYNSGTNVGTVTFQIGETFVGLSIISVADVVSDPNETVIIDLDSYSGGQIGSTATSTYTIQEPEVAFPVTSGSNSESSTSTNFSVDLNTVFASNSTVTFSLSGTATYTTDYTVQNNAYVSYDSNTNTGTITYYAYQQNVSMYLSIVNNAIAEPNETVIVTLNSFDQGAVGTNSVYTYTINNDDANRVGFSAASASGAESVSSYNATVQLDIADNSQNTTFDLLITGTATNGSEYSVSTGPYTITQGNTSTTVPVTIYNDVVDEPNETVVMTLTNISGNVVGGTVAQTYTITDDDDAYAKIFLDSGLTTEADTNTNKINIGDTIYFKVNDARFNTNIGSVNTISSSFASVVSDGGDTEGVTLTETAADSNIFTGSITTISDTIAADGILQIQGADTVNLVISSTGSTTIDDFSTYSSTSTNPGALTSASNGLAGYWGSVGGTSTLQNNAGNQYISSTSSAGNMYVVRSKSTAASVGYNFSDTNLAFDISISNTGYSSATWTLSTQTFTGLNILLVDNATCYYYQQVTTPISSNSASPTSVSIPRTGFTQSSIGAPCSFNFSDIRSTFFIVPSTVVNTVTVDNLSQNALINYQSSDALVIGGPTAVTLNAATNITTSSMDLSWSENVDVDFANYKVYYSTTSPVSLASTVATTITNSATLTYQLTGLSPSTQYFIRVLVTNNTAAKTWSNQISPTTDAPPVGYCETTDGMICFSNSGFTADAASPIAVGDSLYLVAHDTAFNTNATCTDVITVTLNSIDGLSAVRDTESISLAETGVNTGTFNSVSALTTSGTNSVGVLNVASDDTVYAKAYSVSQNFDGAYTISHPAGGSGITSNFIACPTGPNYIEEVVDSSNTSGDVLSTTLTTPLNMPNADSLLTMRVKFDTTAQLGTTTAIPFPFQFTGLNVMVTNNTGGNNIADVTWPSTSLVSDGNWFTITVPRSDFDRTEDLGGGAVPLSSGDWTAVSNFYVIFPNNSSNVTGSFDNIGVGYTSAYSDSIAVGTPPPPDTPIAVTLNTATNVTATSMDISWSQNVDGDFQDYKIYYATHPTVTTADTLATTITNQATTTYSLTGLTSGTTYYMRALVTNTALDTAFSNERSAATNGAAGVTVTATIPPLISYSLSTQNCNLGVLSDTGLSVCNFDITVSTNAAAGYVAYIESQNNGILTNGSNQIAPASSSTISAGTAGWGIGTSESGLGGSGEIPTTASCSTSNSPTLKGLSTTSNTIARSTAPSDSRVTNICVGATISTTTPAGSYSDNVLITIVGNF